MKELIKNFIFMVFSTVIWTAGLLIVVGVYIVLTGGTAIEEIIFLAIAITIFTSGILLVKKSKRLQAAMGFPLFPSV